MKVILLCLLIIGSVGFNQVLQFDLIDEIELPNEIELRQVEFVDVNQEGDLLLTDVSSGMVILYTAETQTFRVLDPEECHPGYVFSPQRAHFVKDGVWVFNHQPQVFKFQYNGECVGPIDQKIEAPDFFAEVNSDVLTGYKPLKYDLESPILQFYDHSAVETKTIELGGYVSAPTFSFRYGGGGMFANSNNVYFALSSAPIIYSVNTIDGDVKRFEPSRSMGYSVVQRNDIARSSRGNTGLLLDEVRNYLSEYTTTIHFDKLNDKYTLLHIMQPDRSGRELLIFDLDDEQFLNDSYIMDGSAKEFYYAYADSKAYNIIFDEDNYRWALEVYQVTVQAGN